MENAFAYSRKVFTLSLHKCEEGFFPGTGTLNEVPSQKKHVLLNIVLIYLNGIY